MDNVRTQGILGKESSKRLRQKTVLVVGLGGVGSFCVEALARTGIGHLILVDADVFEDSNRNRQLGATQETIGQKKTEVLKKRVLSITDAQVDTYDFFYDHTKDKELFSHTIDFVCDCIDSLSSKQDLIQACLLRQIPFLSCMGMGRRFDPTKLEVMELEKTSNDPLAKRLRIWKRKQRIKNKIPVVCSRETPIPQVEGQPLASVIFVPASAGLLIAKECIERLLK